MTLGRVGKLILLTMTLCGCVTASYSSMRLQRGINAFSVQNYQTAYRYLLPEAKNGNKEAQYAIGYLYFYGFGVVENHAKARYWMEKAAASGHPKAAKALRLIKSRG